MGILGRVGNLLALVGVLPIETPIGAQGLPDTSIPPELRAWVLESMLARDCRTRSS
jgi:hypothetical protein